MFLILAAEFLFLSLSMDVELAESGSKGGIIKVACKGGGLFGSLASSLFYFVLAQWY